MISSIDTILSQKRILVTCGTGGVGKTTLSAALAVRAACLGKNAVVITVDPAKRLATSLGLERLGDEPSDLTPLLLNAFRKARASGLPTLPHCEGKLSAITPDTRLTFETFVAGLTSTPEAAKRVTDNPIFQIFAKEFSGTNEYMALQRLYALDQLKQFDCIILDTPPSRNTLAFLDAPTLLARFFEEKLIHWLAMPANRLFSAPMRKAFSMLEKLTGSGFMTYLFDFAGSLFEVRKSFSANLKAITELLKSDQVGFILVAHPSPENTQEIGHFIESVHAHGFHFEGLALNRTLSYLQPDGSSSSDPKVKEALEIISALQQREERAIADLQEKIAEKLDHSKKPVVYAKLPELARDVHSVEDLFHVAMAFDHHER